MIFISLWTTIFLVITYHKSIKPMLVLARNKREAITKGIVKYGEVVGSKREVKMFINKKPIFRYFAQIRLNDSEETQFWTKPLVFDPKILLSETVKVYVYNDIYYVTDFQLPNRTIMTRHDNTEKKSRITSEQSDTRNSKGSMITGVMGLVFMGILIFFMIQISHYIGIMILTPFLISSIGVVLKGFLPFLNNKQPFLNILGDKVSLLGFGLFWFGVVGFSSYMAIKERNIGMVLFLLLFWIVGYFKIIKPLFKIKIKSF